MSEILIGTCGYFYKDWVGPVYPKGTRQEDYLSLYAGCFSTVELDFAYYAMPQAPQLANMIQLWGSESAARFDYLYNDKELESWGDRLRRIVLEAERILVYFNNHRKGQAVENAQTLMQLLDKTGLSGDLMKVKGVKHDTTGNLPF